MDIRKDIERMIKAVLNMRENEHIAIENNTHLENDLGMDSMEMIRLQLDIEDTYGFEFDPVEDDFDTCFSTYGVLCKCVSDKVKMMQ